MNLSTFVERTVSNEKSWYCNES